MWVFTEWANAFNKVKTDNAKSLDSWLQDWVATTLDDNSPWYRNAFIYTVSGLTYAVNTMSTEVLGSFVDVLRLGDGVREGGWGYGRDALRLLVLAGPALRVARYGIAIVAAVDETQTVGNCTWIAASRALRLTGVKHFARLGDLAKAAGLSGIGETGGAFVDDLLMPLNNMGADARSLGTFSSMTEVVEAARANPNGVVMFSVEWEMGGKTVGHTLLATRGPGGVIAIIDRSAKVISLVDGFSLAELEGTYAGISNATVYGTAGVVQNARIVSLLNTAPSLVNLLALELRSAPVPPPLLDSRLVVLKTDSQLLEGWWWVRVKQFEWIYHFFANGTVRWRDPWNLKTGKGTWTVTPNSIQISWAPTSKTKEFWNLPISTGYQLGTYTDTESTTLTAMKFDLFQQTSRQLIGKWRVRVQSWTWIYEFDSNFGVRWTDPSNNMTGDGSWEFLKDSVFVSWAPKSATTEKWMLPLDGDVSGSCKMAGRILSLSATRSG